MPEGKKEYRERVLRMKEFKARKAAVTRRGSRVNPRSLTLAEMHLLEDVLGMQYVKGHFRAILKVDEIWGPKYEIVWYLDYWRTKP